MSREADPHAPNVGASVGSPDTIDRSRLNAADQLFAALDGQIVTAHAETWELRIFGIYVRADRSWLQFRLSGAEQIDGVAAVDGQAPERVLQRIRSGLDQRVSGSLTLVC